jgi:hypothetical protein
VSEFLHNRRDFEQLLAVVADDRGLDPMLVEKDYWIMHCLWGLQAQGFEFELKGGTSLSKGFGVIHRFSEDIDIRKLVVTTTSPLTLHQGAHTTMRWQCASTLLALRVLNGTHISMMKRCVVLEFVFHTHLARQAWLVSKMESCSSLVLTTQHLIALSRSHRGL